MSLFDNEQSRILIYWLFFIIGAKGITTRNEVTDVLHYLSRILTKPLCGIGVILMPKIMYSTTFLNFARATPKPSGDQIMQAISNILAQVVKLFIVNRVIHTDLHTSNVLVYPSTTGIKSELIDFGRIINVNEPNIKIDDAINDFIKDFFNITQPGDKLLFIRRVIGYIQSIIEVKTPQNKQMVWLINFINDFPDVCSQAFDTLKDYYVVLADKPTRMTNATIKRYVSEGGFFDLARPLSDYYMSSHILNDQQYALASKTAVNTSSVQMASAAHPAVQNVGPPTTDVSGNAKRKRPETAQNGSLKNLKNDNTTIVDVNDAESKRFETTMFDEVNVHAESITFEDGRTIFDADGSNSTIVDNNDDVDKFSMPIDEAHYKGGKKSRRRRKTRIRRKRMTRRRTRKRVAQNRQMRKGYKDIKRNN